MFRFEHPLFFYAFACIPVFVGIFIWNQYRRRKKLEKLGQSALVKQLMPEVSFAKRLSKLILYCLAYACVVLALCNLQTGSKMKNVKRQGSDILVCIDVSNSMLAQDLSPNRLERAKFAMEKMIDQLEGDRLGIIVFAGEAYVQLPITTDYGAAKLFLSSISPGMIATQGTNISAAINRALESFGKDEGKNKAIVIITDGEDHEENAIKAAEEAAGKDITIHTIGIGSANGVPIPNMRDGMLTGYKKDREGNTVVTRLNSTLLEQIAAAGNGVYVQASNADVGLDTVLGKIAELDKKDIESKMYTDYEDQFQWFLAGAFLFLLIEFFITERSSTLWKKLNVFGHAS